MRRFYILREIYSLKESKWINIEMKDLCINDIFKIFDDGKLVTDRNGNDTWIATSNPYINNDGIYAIMCVCND